MRIPYLECPLVDRLSTLAPGGVSLRLSELSNDSLATVMVGVLAERKVVIIATDPQRASGAIGVNDAQVLAAGIDYAKTEQLPLVFMVDSAGALLTEGVRVLGAFRILQRTLLEARSSGLPVLAIIGRNCFGGASLLAFTADTRVYPRGCRLGLSGPRALSALGLLESDLLDLYAPESRARHDEAAVLVSDDTEAVAAVIKAWLSDPGARQAPGSSALRNLTRRLRMYQGDPATLTTSEIPSELETRLDHLFPEGWSASYGNGVVWGDGWLDGRDTCFAGFLGGQAVGVFACWRMLEALRGFRQEPVDIPITLLLDCPGQTAELVDEQLLLSEFVARVAEAAHAFKAAGRSVELWLLGEAGGAIYVALAAAATTITAWPGLRLQTLPPRAVDGVIGTRAHMKPTLSALFEARVIDRWTRAPGFGEVPALKADPKDKSN